MAIATVYSSTGQLIKSFESLTGAEIEAKLQRAADIFGSDHKLPFAQRAGWMLPAAAILQQEKAYGEVLTTEMARHFAPRSTKWRSARGSAGIMRKTRNDFWRMKWWKRGQSETTSATSHRAGPGGAAVKFSVLAGAATRGTRADDRKRWTAEARFQRSAKRAAD